MMKQVRKFKKIKIYSPLLGLLSFISIIVSIVLRFKNIKNKYIFISLSYITALLSGLLFLDNNLKPDEKITEHEEEEFEMEVDDLD